MHDIREDGSEEIPWGYRGQYSTHMFTRRAEEIALHHQEVKTKQLTNKVKTDRGYIYIAVI